MSTIGGIKAAFDRLVAGFAELIHQLGNVYSLIRFILIIAVFFLAGRVISARRVPAAEEEVHYEPIEDILKKLIGSEIAPDVVNLVIFSSAFDFINNLVRLIESTDIIDKERYFPKPAMERLKGIIADIQMKIEDFKKRYNIEKEYRDTIYQIIESAATEYCMQLLRLEAPTPEAHATRKSSIPPEELERKKREEEFERIFEEALGEKKEKPEAIESRMEELVDIVESYGI